MGQDWLAPEKYTCEKPKDQVIYIYTYIYIHISVAVLAQAKLSKLRPQARTSKLVSLRSYACAMATSVINEDSASSGAADFVEDIAAGGKSGVDDDMTSLTAEDHAAEGISALIDRMEERRVAGKTILVEPADLLTKEAQVMAEGSLSLVDVEEYVELKSFIEANLERKLESMPVDAAIPHNVRVATEQRESYYVWMRQFLVKKSLHRRILAHKMMGDKFLALLPPNSLAETNMRHLGVTCARAMTQAILPSFDTALWNAWKQKEEVFDLLDVEVDLDSEFMNFLVEQYYPTMKEVLSKHAAEIFEYVPPVPVDHDASPCEVEKRQKSLQQVDAFSVAEVDQLLLNKWDAFVGACDESIQKLCQKGRPSEKFVFRNYYPTLFEVLAEKSKAQAVRSASASGHDHDSPGVSDVVTSADSQVDVNSAGSQGPSLWGMDILLSGQAMSTEVAPKCNVEFMSACEILQATPKTNAHSRFEPVTSFAH